MAKKWQKKALYVFIISIFIIFSSLIFVACGEQKPNPTSITFAQSEIEAFLGQEQSLSYTLEPANANPYLEWSSSNKKIVSVNSSGRISAKSYGEAVITAKVPDSDIEASVVVKVTDGKIVYLEINFLELKVDYFDGEKIEAIDFPITGYYQSGKSVTMTPDSYTVDAPEFATEGAKVIISSPLMKAPYEISLIIKPDYVNSIEITSLPQKTEYFINETFDPAGMEIELLYASGKREKTTDFYFDMSPIEAGQEKIEITCKGFSEEISITTKTRITARKLTELKNAIENGYDSILLTGSHNTSSPIILENVKNVTIVGENGSMINGYDIVPIIIKGKVENLKFYNLKINVVGDERKSNIVDFTECTGGNIYFKNVHFGTPQTSALLIPENLDLTTTFNNCTYSD